MTGDTWHVTHSMWHDLLHPASGSLVTATSQLLLMYLAGTDGKCKECRQTWNKQKKSGIRATLGPLVRVWIGLPILYHESKSIPLVLSIPWVQVYTMSPCLYHDSMFIPLVHVYTMSPWKFHESMSIPWVLANNMIQCLYLEIQITEIKKYKLQIYRNTIFRNSEIQI